MSGGGGRSWVRSGVWSVVVAVTMAAAVSALTLDELVRAASDTCDALPLEMLFTLPYTPQLDVMEFTRVGQRSYKLTKAHKFLRNRLPNKLIIYIPGWGNTPTDESSKTIANAILKRNHLLLIVDTRSTFFRGYVASATKVSGMSESLYKFISHLYYDGYSPSSIHLIGFSLGAHVAGMTGKLVQSRLNKHIGRITALDPARPCFGQPSEYRLEQRDAKFVQVIHTSVGVLGIEQPLGDVDVYVNGVSVPQPECRDEALTLECDHAQAWRLYSASVTNERALLSRKCRNWNELSSGLCSGNETVTGYGCSSNTRGIYLYKSHEVARRKDFNPFDLHSWLGR